MIQAKDKEKWPVVSLFKRTREIFIELKKKSFFSQPNFE